MIAKRLQIQIWGIVNLFGTEFKVAQPVTEISLKIKSRGKNRPNSSHEQIWNIMVMRAASLQAVPP